MGLVNSSPSKMKNNTTTPPSFHTNLLKGKYTHYDDMVNYHSFFTCQMGNFYISDANMKGMAFCESYKNAIWSYNYKMLCTFVGSMISDVYPPLRNSVEVALKGIGVKPVLVSLPSQARQHNIALKTKVPDMDFPTILVYFGCCVILLFIKSTNEDNYNTIMSNCIFDLRETAECDPTTNLVIPFDHYRANAIRTMLGACSTLRGNIIRFLIDAANTGDTGIGGVCQYICSGLTWSGMPHFNDVLAKQPSFLLLHSTRVSTEAEDLNKARARARGGSAAITTHPNYPQFIMPLAPKL